MASKFSRGQVSSYEFGMALARTQMFEAKYNAIAEKIAEIKRKIAEIEQNQKPAEETK